MQLAVRSSLKTRAGSSGFSLVELIVTMMLVSITVLAMSSALSFSFSHQSDGLWQTKSVTLAESYIEEIMARRFDETTPIGGVPPCAPATTPCGAIGSDGETRAEFDDVDDFNGVDDLPPLDLNGNSRAEYSGYRVQVSVAYVDAALVTSLGLDATTDAKLVTITVTPPGRSSLEFSFLRTNY